MYTIGAGDQGNNFGGVPAWKLLTVSTAFRRSEMSGYFGGTVTPLVAKSLARCMRAVWALLIESPRIRIDSCGEWKPIPLLAAT